MFDHLEGDILPPQDIKNRGVIFAERVWQHRHDLELKRSKPKRIRSGMLLLVTCSCVLGAIYAFDRPTSAISHSSEIKAPLVAHSSVSADAVSAPKPQDGINPVVAPVGIDSASETNILPFNVIPAKRPIAEAAKSSIPQKPDRPDISSKSAGVVLYDQCSPRCETRDPLAVGRGSTVVSTTDIIAGADVGEVQDQGRMLDSNPTFSDAGTVLMGTATLPLRTIEVARNVVNGIVRHN
jgi:hypothetical protein